MENTGISDWLFVLIPSALISLYLLGPPLLSLILLRFEAFPTLLKIDPAEYPFIPEEVRAHFFSSHEHLTSLQFQYSGVFLLPSAVPNVRAWVSVYMNQQECIGAMSAAMLNEVAGVNTVKVKYVEFSTRYSDGAINTGNQPIFGAFPLRAGYVSTIHPGLTDVTELYHAHRALMTRFGQQRQPLNRLTHVFNGDAAAWISSGMTEEFEDARRCGYLRFSGGEQERFSAAQEENPYRVPLQVIPPKYAPTLKGAYLMTWKELWPIKSVFRWRRFRRDRTLLAEAGRLRKSSEQTLRQV